MAVRVVARERFCPNCHECIAFISDDVKKVIKKERVSVYDSNTRKNIPMIKVTEEWYVTCPTCHKQFKADEFNGGYVQA